jgi:hypothetical protein
MSVRQFQDDYRVCPYQYFKFIIPIHVAVYFRVRLNWTRLVLLAKSGLKLHANTAFVYGEVVEWVLLCDI